MSTGLMRGDTGGLLNDASLSNPIVSEAIAKWFKNYKLSCDKHHTKALHDTTRGYYTQHYAPPGTTWYYSESHFSDFCYFLCDNISNLKRYG